jgi:hypothetical protein
MSVTAPPDAQRRAQYAVAIRFEIGATPSPVV